MPAVGEPQVEVVIVARVAGEAPRQRPRRRVAGGHVDRAPDCPCGFTLGHRSNREIGDLSGRNPRSRPPPERPVERCPRKELDLAGDRQPADEVRHRPATERHVAAVQLDPGIRSRLPGAALEHAAPSPPQPPEFRLDGAGRSRCRLVLRVGIAAAVRRLLGALRGCADRGAEPGARQADARGGWARGSTQQLHLADEGVGVGSDVDDPSRGHESGPVGSDQVSPRSQGLEREPALAVAQHERGSRRAGSRDQNAAQRRPAAVRHDAADVPGAVGGTGGRHRARRQQCAGHGSQPYDAPDRQDRPRRTLPVHCWLARPGAGRPPSGLGHGFPPATPLR